MQKQAIWIDRQGKEYFSASEISDSHLKNIIHMLERQSMLLLSDYPNFQGEMAQYYAEQEYDNMSYELSNRLNYFYVLAEKRGIKLYD
ncbi:hypothetical protein HYS50_03395 [Candidatus Woesearchaeota archaeon]|nr:hypothetical protein [Candidatus Woesearchaeota archaeon]